MFFEVFPETQRQNVKTANQLMLDEILRAAFEAEDLPILDEPVTRRPENECGCSGDGVDDVDEMVAERGGCARCEE